MRITGVIWLDNIVDKLAYKHNVLPDEVEEALGNYPKIRFATRGQKEGEDVYLAPGRTNTGRYLTVLFIYKWTQQALVISARDMADKERKQYERK